MKRFRFLWRLTGGQRIALLSALTCQFAASFFAMLPPQIIRVFIDSVIGEAPLEVPGFIAALVNGWGGVGFLRSNYWVAAVLIVLVGLGYFGFRYLYDLLAGGVGETVAKRMRDRIYTHLVRLPYDYFVKTPAGDILQRCSSDIGEIQGLLTSDLLAISGAVIMVILNLTMMITIDPFLTLISLALFPVMILLNIFVKGRISRSFSVMKSRSDDLAGFMHQYVQGIRVVKAFGRQAFERKRFSAVNQNAGEALRDREYAGAAYWPFFLAVTLAQTALVIIFGIFRASSGASTVGAVVAISTYARSLMNQLGHFGYIMISIAGAQVALKRLDDILDKPVEDMSGVTPDAPPRGEIAFRDMSFSFGEKQILRDITFSVQPGQTIGILGKTGSGKSTLVQLFLRLYDYDHGEILLDGRPLRTLSREYLRKYVGVILQEPFLFSRSVSENIAIAREDAGQEAVEEYASIACVDGDIRAFNQGYETVVGEKGITVSGGQRQRIAIAQTLIRDTPILILDDSLSAVDIDTDRHIREQLRLHTRDKTIFLISHRVDSLRSADHILVFENGRITQQGTHEALAAQEGLYRRIMEIQRAEGRAVS